MRQANVNVGPLLAQHTHTKSAYAQVINAELQVQHGQARLHPKKYRPRLEVLWHQSPRTSRQGRYFLGCIFLQEIVPI